MNYLGNFSMEWHIHKGTQLDSMTGTMESEKTLIDKTDFDLSKVKDKLVLDAGCGAGRFAEVLARYGANVVGVDMSDAVNSARDNLKGYPNVQIVRADIMDLPFADGTFDYIFSIGVLHHTPNTEQAFKVLPRFLKKGGELAVWVYSNEGIIRKVYNRISEFYRLFSTNLPLKVLYVLCYGAIPLYYLKKIPVLGKILMVLLPSSIHSGWRWMILDTFDWYSPRYQWKHTYREVEQWFKHMGMVDIARLDIPVAVRGRKL